MTAKINSIFVFLVKDENGEEGICAVNTPNGVVPLVCSGSDMTLLEQQMRPAARAIAQEHRLTITLCRFDERMDLEEILPK